MGLNLPSSFALDYSYNVAMQFPSELKALASPLSVSVNFERVISTITVCFNGIAIWFGYGKMKGHKQALFRFFICHIYIGEKIIEFLPNYDLHFCLLYHIYDFIWLLNAAGPFWEMLHNSYVKCGIAMVSLFGPGRGNYHLPVFLFQYILVLENFFLQYENLFQFKTTLSACS